MLATLSLKWDHSSRVTTVQFIERETQWREFWAIFSKITFNCTIWMHEQFVRLIAMQCTSFYHNRKCATVQILLCIKRNRLSILVQINLQSALDEATSIAWFLQWAHSTRHSLWRQNSHNVYKTWLFLRWIKRGLIEASKLVDSRFFSFVSFYYGLRCSLR